MAQARSVKAQQDSARAHRQQLTQELKAVLEDGRDKARRIRGLATARIGPKSERIVQFGMAPLRKGSRRAKVAEPTPPPPEAVPPPRGGEPPSP